MAALRALCSSKHIVHPPARWALLNCYVCDKNHLILLQSPCFPDPDPCDFFLFLILNNELKVRRFDTIGEQTLHLTTRWFCNTKVHFLFTFSFPQPKIWNYIFTINVGIKQFDFRLEVFGMKIYDFRFKKIWSFVLEMHQNWLMKTENCRFIWPIHKIVTLPDSVVRHTVGHAYVPYTLYLKFENKSATAGQAKFLTSFVVNSFLNILGLRLYFEIEILWLCYCTLNLLFYWNYHSNEYFTILNILVLEGRNSSCVMGFSIKDVSVISRKIASKKS